jgi:hypothetical protein
MSYESKIIIVNRSVIESRNGTLWVYGEQIADIDMSCMCQGFVELFKNEIDYKLCVENSDEPTKEDRYGKVMTYTDCKTVIKYLKKLIANGNNYRRLNMLLGLLKGINEDQWEDIQVVHYGY